MLDLVHRYANGFVSLRVILALREHGVLDRLRAGVADVTALAHECGANEGPLRVAIRLLFELGWTAPACIDGGDSARKIPADAGSVLELDWRTEPEGCIWIRRWIEGWPGIDPAVAELLEGALAVPLLAELNRNGARPLLAREDLRQLFIRLEWGERSGEGFRVTEAGDYMIRSGAHLGTVLSYGPLFSQMDKILFGDYASVFARDAYGHESHIDRAMNVVSSGRQHQSYFAELEEAVVGYFDSLPVHEQPACIADMGCGDGTLLARLYQAVSTRSSRAGHLDRFPLRVAGVDFNRKALEETARTLASIPHILVEGDIGDPRRMLADLGALGIRAEEILHVRSFLDHDRPFRAPAGTVAAGGFHTGVYVAVNGGAIPAAAVVQSLVEHLRRWKVAGAKHGLTLLEVHNVGPETVRANPHGSECLHFDAYHGFSGQQLVEAPVFLMAAAEAGLFPDPAVARRYPRMLGFTRITLNRFEARPYIGRHPRPEDLPALVELEARCFTGKLRAAESELHRRITAFPAGVIVIECDGAIAGVAYAQRIRSIEHLRRCRYEDVASLADPSGRFVQLLGLLVDPVWQSRGLGDQLLTFVLACFALWESVDGVTGVTRCREYRKDGGRSFEEYVAERDEQGRPVDPILRFHISHGARIEGVLPDFRPDDADNEGAGVLIAYDFRERAVSPAVIAEPGRDADVETTVREAVVEVLGVARRQAYRRDAPLMSMGLESLDLLELRHLLSSRLDRVLAPSFFFRYGTPAAIAGFLSHGEAAPEVKAAEARDDRGYAIVGMACRFPGGADSPERYWDLLARGVDAVGELPPDRAALFHTRDLADLPLIAGLVDGIDQFDAEFFRISPREARFLDPQQRFLLEVAWESLENAGIDPRRLESGLNGVFVGAISRDYEALLFRSGAGEAWVPTGNASSMAAGRLAYFLDWHGPAITVDTACSSSLLAVHMACRALERGDCNLALAGGVNLLLAPETSLAYWHAGMLSPDGRCRTFDAAANGYVRGEGCGLVVIKRLRDAVNDEDRVLAVIRGSAVNQDGAGSGLTAPNQRAQEQLIQAALQEAGVEPAQVDYLEAHGTGTNLGDPVELGAALAVLGQGRGASAPLLVGSVKTNIGHLEGAAGVAGLIKVVLAMGNRSIPRHLHFEKPNPHFAWESHPVRVVSEAMAWPARNPAPIAGVSSFGFSGTNAHVVVEGPPAEVSAEGAADRSGHVLVVSGRNAPAMRAMAARYRDWLERNPDVSLADFCYTAGACRKQFDVSAEFVVASVEEAREALGKLERNEAAPAVVDGVERLWKGRRLAIPTYPFQRKRYWVDAAPAKDLLYRIAWREVPQAEPVDRGGWSIVGEGELAEALGSNVGGRLVYLPGDAEPDVESIGNLIRNASSLHIVTRGAWAIGDEEVNPRQRIWWGLGKVLSIEQPDLWRGLIDLPADADANWAGPLLAELSREDGEDQIALRGGIRYAARLARVESLPATQLNLRDDASYLITGGLGSVGLQLAEWLAANGATHIVLTARTAPAELPVIEGCRVSVKTADVSCREEVAALLNEIEPPLRGVIHAAGVLAEGKLDEQSQAAFESVLAPKVRGGWNLHELTQDCALDFFVCVSSIAAVWGSPEQGAYAAANAYLDGLASYRRQRGLPGLSVNFGPWGAGGMAARVSRTELARRGVRSLNGTSALWALGALWGGALSEAVVAAVDWPLFRGVYEARRERRLLAEMGNPAAAPLGDRNKLERHLRSAVGKILGIAAEELDLETGFADLGMDSIMAVELRKLLQQDYGRTVVVPTTVAFDYPSVRALTDFFAGSSKERAPQPAVAAGAIAIVGMGCRFPGAADVESYWRLLEEGREAIVEIPRDRWNIDDYFDPDPDAAGCMYTRYGGFLEQVDSFDAGLFGISPREAVSMDPQQRLLLEVSWEALESAACGPLSLKQSRTGVYVGVGSNEYAQIVSAGGVASIDAYYGAGNAVNVIAGRVAFALGLEGPAMAIDTACSSSLVAVHQACQGLRGGECDLALAGGVNLILTPATMIATCRAKMLAADGRCKTFDAAADGYVRGEGCGVVVLKRLADAERDGDRVLAVIRGSAVNQDGASSGLTVPNGPAQERVVREALAQAGLEGRDVDYLEAHGTGTSLGDPIEVQAAAAALGAGRTEPLLLGSVKTNIGHLEAASGMAGLIKVVLAMGHGKIPRHLHFEKPNPHIAWTTLPVKVVGEGAVWRAGKRPVAGVSSFGFSGTNAHVVVEGAAERETKSEVTARGEHLLQSREHLLVLSGKTEAALRELAGRYAEWIRAHPETDLEALCQTCATGRSHLEERAALLVHSLAEAEELLVKVRNGEPDKAIYRGRAKAKHNEPEAWTTASAAAQSYIAGSTPDFGSCQALDLPTYAFQRQRYWVENPGPVRAKIQPLLGGRIDLVTGETIYQTTFSCDEQPFLRDHKLYDTVTVPGATYGALAILAAGVPARLEDVVFREPLLLGDRERRELQMILLPADEKKRREFRVFSWPAGATGSARTQHASGWIVPARAESAGPAPLDEWRRRLTPMAPEALFEQFRALGLELGPALRSIRAVWRTEGEALVELKIPGVLRAECAGVPIHPAVFDACTQALGAIWGVTGESFFAPLEYRGVDLREAVPCRFYCFAKLTGQTSGETRTFDIELRTVSGEWLGAIEGFTVKRAPREIFLRGLKSGIDSWFYTIEWQEQKADLVFDAGALAEAARGAVAEVARAAGIDAQDARLGTALEDLGRGYAARAIAQVNGHVTPQHRRLLRRMVEVQADAPVVGNPEEALRELMTRFPHGRFELELLGRCGARLAEVLTGKTDPLSLLVPEEGNGARNIYIDAPIQQVWNRLIGGVCADAVLGLPAGRMLRVLEIGAGSGATTGEVLPRLASQCAEYLFTDISAGFFDAAEKQFGEYPCVRYRKVDIERDPRMQGVEAYRYDIVLAVNVLHATKDLEVALRHVRQMLAPGGLLVLLEAVDRQVWLDLTFGLLDGWWRFDDAVREHHVLLNARQWRGLLEEQGFQGTESLAPEGLGGQALILARAPEESSSWLVVSEQRETAAQIAEALVKRGHRCVVAAQMLEDDAARWDGVVYLAAADSACEGALSLVQTMARGGAAPARGLWLVTAGGKAVNAPLWGMARVIALEHPQFRCRQIDCDQTRLLIEQLLRDGDENQRAVRDGVCFVPRLIRPPLNPAGGFRPRGTWLITGAFGGLGLAVTRWLDEKGVGRLVLNGRMPPHENTPRDLRADVEVVIGDVSREEDARRMLAGHRFSGVIHAAGTLHDGALVNQTWQNFEDVFAAKVRGASHLDRLTREHPLEYFVLFSSSVSMLGNRGQANHAAANAFLDQLAHDRRAEGLPGVSINWGPWSKIGAAARGGSRLDSQFHEAGMGWIDPEQGLDALDRILSTDIAQVGVAPVDWAVFARQQGAEVPAMIRALVPASAQKASSVEPRLAQRLKGAAAGEREPLLADYVAQQVMKVLRLEIRPARDLGFFDAGMDSLMAVELRNRISRDLGLERPLPSTVLFDYPSVGAMAAFLARETSPPVPAVPEAEADVLSSLFADVDESELDSFTQEEFDAEIESALRATGESR